MCSPTAVVAVTTVAAAAMSASAQRAQGKYQKDVAEYNASVAENEAEKTRTAGVEAENIQRQKTAQLLAKQRAQLGAAGVELGTGSPLQLQEETVELGEADALRIRSNFEAQAESLETGAALTRTRGEAAKSLGTTRAVGTLLSGGAAALGTGVADKWFKPDSAAKAPAFGAGVTSQPSIFNQPPPGIAGI